MAEYGLFFGEAGTVEDPADILRSVLGREVEMAACSSRAAVRLRFADTFPLAVLNEAEPIVLPNGMLGYGDEEIPYDRFAFEIGFARDLSDDVELLAVLDLGRLLRRGNVAVMVDEGGEKVVLLDEMAPSRGERPILVAGLISEAPRCTHLPTPSSAGAVPPPRPGGGVGKEVQPPSTVNDACFLAPVTSSHGRNLGDDVEPWAPTWDPRRGRGTWR